LKIQKEILQDKIQKRLNQRLKEGMIKEICEVKKKYDLSDKYLEKLGLEFKLINRFLNKEIDEENLPDFMSKINESLDMFRRFKNYN
jgi:tRNA A37 N6-isopentenylltransferase MiaA